MELRSELTAETRARVRALFAREFDFVWRTLRRFGLDGAEADDGVQHVFMVLTRRLPEIAVGQERGFLFQTARRVAADRRRSTARRREDLGASLEGAAQADSPAELFEQQENRRILDAILGELPEEAREVLVLFELEGVTVPELAQLLAIPEGTVASRLRRARELFGLAVRRHHAKNGVNSGATRESRAIEGGTDGRV